MCRYGTLIAWAEELGHEEIVRFLTTNLNEEKAANPKRNTIALRKGVNKKLRPPHRCSEPSGAREVVGHQWCRRCFPQ
jgi:hypothetical protein